MPNGGGWPAAALRRESVPRRTAAIATARRRSRGSGPPAARRRAWPPSTAHTSRRPGARRRRSITTFGKLMDPLADKLLVIGALLTLVSLGRVAAWVAMVIIAREFAVTVLRMAASQQGVVTPARALGKVKTVMQVAMVFALILVHGSPAWLDALVYATVVVTVLSGVDYFFGLRRRLAEAGVR